MALPMFQGFVLATERLANVAASSAEFGPREKVAAKELYVAALAAVSVNECETAFNAAYRVLGAPGDFGYGSPEGEGMRGVYDAWNKALQERRESAAFNQIDRVQMGM